MQETKTIRSYADLAPNGAYELMYEEYLSEIKTAGIILRHKKSGARICVMANDDENKMFCAAFKTPPSNSTGVPHIIEHSVLNGSKHFPSRDPFMALEKSSLQTFLNAMTFPDKTIYPVASCNDKDFKNLMHVYMDSVFYPNIYNHKFVFMQEGWHYEMNDPSDDLKINGVVYSEMKGSMSSPEGIIEDEINIRLQPDTAYGVNSGGDPDVIPELSYEEFLNFHRTFYHPSNSYIFVYGNCDMDERLRFIDREYLSNFDEIEFRASVTRQPHWNSKEPRYHRSVYDGGESDDLEGKAFFAYNTLAGSSLDILEKRACDVLSSVLINSDFAPVKTALVKAGIGEDIYGGFSGHMIENTFSVIAKNAKEEDLDRFVETVRETLRSEVEKGINEKAIRAALNVAEFNFREANYGGFPKGLDYCINMLQSWLYDDSSAFTYMHVLRDIEKLKELIGTGYYEDIVRKYILDSDHTLILTLVPEKELTVKKNRELAEKLEAYKNSLSPSEIDRIVSETKALREYQSMPPTEEELNCIPFLRRSDISPDTVPFFNEEKTVGNVKTVFHEVDTNGITYANLYFDIGDLPHRYVPYAGLLSAVLGRVDTEERSFEELSIDIGLNTGSLTFEPLMIGKYGKADDYRAFFGIKMRVLSDKVKYASETSAEILTRSKLDDRARLKAIIAEIKSEKQREIMFSGNRVAAARTRSYFSKAGCFEEQIGGIDFYQFITDLLNNFDEKYEEIAENLKKTRNLIFDPSKAILSLAADEAGCMAVDKNLPGLLDAISRFPKESAGGNEEYVPVRRNEGIIIPSMVQYVVSSGNLRNAGYTPTGVLNVVKNSVDIDYLYQQIRVKGGAYGTGCAISADSGNVSFTSYRDPNLKETDLVYSKIGEFIRNYDADEDEMTKAVIGTFSRFDRPMSSVQKAQRSFAAYISGLTYEDLVRERAEMLGITLEQFRETAPLFEDIYRQGYRCTVGSAKIREVPELFDNIIVLE
ncbi:MAG: insulinase family protein [Clostridia bacterium]|nr:insulinase family protein [Clostridia bacterium]